MEMCLLAMGKSMPRALILAVPLLLSGCAATVPPLPVPSALPSSGPYDVGPALDMADKLSAQYARSYQRTATDNRLLALPTIAAAAGAAVLTVANPAGVAQVLAFVGIGAGAYEIGRGALSPKSLPGLYLKGHDALSCVNAESPVFLINQGPAKETGVEKLAEARKELGKQIATAQGWEATGLNGVSDGDETQRLAMQQALSKLSETIVRAKALYATSAADEVAAELHRPRSEWRCLSLQRKWPARASKELTLVTRPCWTNSRPCCRQSRKQLPLPAPVSYPIR